MKILTEVTNPDEVKTFYSLGVREFIVSPLNLSRHGKLKLQETTNLILKAYDLRCRIYLQADLLIKQNEFEGILKDLYSLPLEKITAIRVQDIGLADEILQHLKRKQHGYALHLILETGYNNLESVLSIQRYFFPHLTRIVLGNEIPKMILYEWKKHISVEVEVLGLGPLLLFYSLRKLLKLQVMEENEILFSDAVSTYLNEDQGLKVYENRHGTFIFHEKDICILEFFEEMEVHGLDVIRIDRWNLSDISVFQEIIKLKKSFSSDQLSLIKKKWNNKTFHGFFLENQTDQQFACLKNRIRDKRDCNFMASVLEAKKDRSIVLFVKKSIYLNEKYYFITPLEKRIDFQIHKLKDLNGSDCKEIKAGQIAVIPFIKRITSQTYMYRNNKHIVPI